MEPIVSRVYGIFENIKSHKVEAALLGGALATCLVSSALLIFSVLYSAPKVKDQYKAPKTKIVPSNVTQTDSAGEVVVDIAGAANEPGVYSLPKPARLNDLLAKARGLSEQANTDYVAKSLNLAQTLSDQQKIYIPMLGEEAPSVSNMAPQSAIVENTPNGLSEGPLLNINSASKSELEDLPGIGQITAEKIIEGRPYSSIEELSKNGILKKAIFDGLKEQISI